jgi:hypothetical protein
METNHFLCRLAVDVTRLAVDVTPTQVTVVFAFTALFCACAYNVSQLSQQFNLTDVIPDDSYLVGFFDALDDYSARSSTAPFVDFCKADQSNKSVQEQMETYMNNLVTINAIVDQPVFFRLRDFKVFLNESEDSLAQEVDFNGPPPGQHCSRRGWLGPSPPLAVSLTWITVMSIGLLVHYVMHVLLRHYESSGIRKEKLYLDR